MVAGLQGRGGGGVQSGMIKSIRGKLWEHCGSIAGKSLGKGKGHVTATIDAKY